MLMEQKIVRIRESSNYQVLELTGVELTVLPNETWKKTMAHLFTVPRPSGSYDLNAFLIMKYPFFIFSLKRFSTCLTKY